MNTRADRIIGQIGSPIRVPPMEINPLQRALENYQDMERDRDLARAEANSLRATNAAMLSEVGMLREALERADSDRIRLQAISSTLLGRLLAINDTIGGAVKAAIKDGIEATRAASAEDELERDAQAAQAILQRVQPHEPPETPAERTAPHGAAVGGLPPSPFRR